jgi:hypothetical protein
MTEYEDLFSFHATQLKEGLDAPIVLRLYGEIGA